MSPAVEEFLSPTSSSTQRTYFQNPNPSVRKHPTDSGVFDDGLNVMNSTKLDFDCSNDARAVRSSRRKHVKTKKQSASVKPVNGASSATGFVFNATSNGSVLNSSLGQTESGEQQTAGEFLDFDFLRFNLGATDNSKLAKNMDSEEAQHGGNKFQDGNLKFVFGAGEKGDTRKVSENGDNKSGKLNGMDFLFGTNTNNGIMNSNSSNIGHENGPDEKVGRSVLDGFMEVNNDATKAASNLVNSMSGLNLGTKRPGEVGNPKAEEKNTSDSRKYENIDFVFSANHRDIMTDLNSQNVESKDKVFFGTTKDSGTATADLGKKDFKMNSTEIKSGDGVNSNLSKDNGAFHVENENEKRSSFKENRKISDEMGNLKSERTENGDYSKKLNDHIDSVPENNTGFVFGSNFGNAFGNNHQSKIFEEMNTSNIHDPLKINVTDKINDSVGDSSNNFFVFGTENRDMSHGRSDTAFLNQCDFGTSIAGCNTPNIGTSFTSFNTPDINVSTSFTLDMFPGLGKKLEFSKSKSVGPRKFKKMKGKFKQQPKNGQEHSFEESPAFNSPMDFSPYGPTDCAPTSTDPPTSQIKDEDAVDTTKKQNVDKISNSSDNVDASARQRPHLKKYKMKSGRGLEFKTPNCRADASRAREYTNQENIKATDEEICDKWRKRGNHAYKNGELSEAEICYSKGISSIQHTATPGFCIEPLVLCYSNRAATLMALGRMREGLKDCRMAAILDPTFMKANLRSANCHLLLGEIDEAVDNYNKCLNFGNKVILDRGIAIEAADGLQKAQKVVDYTKMSAELLEQKTYDSATNALRVIGGALSISCYSEKLLHMKGEALLVLGKHQEVIQMCEETLGLAERNLATGGVVDDLYLDGYDSKNSFKLWRWALMSKSYFHIGKFEMALELIEKHEQLRSSTDKIVGPEESLNTLAVTIRELLQCKNAGNEAFQNGKHAEAVEHYTCAISKSIGSRSFAAVCFCNRAAAHQSLGGIVDAIGDCSIAIALDGTYPKALSRRATLQEMIRDYKHAADDLQRLISILEKQSRVDRQKSAATPGAATGGSVKDLRRARSRLSSIEEKAKKGRSLDLYLILGIKQSDAAAEVKKAYRKAALRHHPDKAGQILARAESGSDGQWKAVAESIQTDADRLFKMIGEAYAVLSDSTKRTKYDQDEETWDEMYSNNVSSSSSRRASDFYSSPYETSNRRNSQESRKSYGGSHYYYWQDSRHTYHSSSYPRW